MTESPRIVSCSAFAAAAAAALCCVVLACRTTTGSGSLRREEGGGVEAQATAAAPATPEPAPTTIEVDARPTVLVTPSDDAYLVLRAVPERRADGLALDVVYLAAADVAELARPERSRRLAASARDLVRAFGTIAEVAQAKRVSVSAVFGAPAGAAEVHRLVFTREPAGWRQEEAEGPDAAARLPPFSAEVVRDPAEEAGARRAAEAFISDVDRADYDAAWTKASAVVKAAMSRVEFQRRLDALPRAGDESGEVPYISFSLPMLRFLPGALIVAWIERATAVGTALEMLVLRLDDDMEWRVAGIAELTEATAASAMSAYADPVPAGR